MKKEVSKAIDSRDRNSNQITELTPEEIDNLTHLKKGEYVVDPRIVPQPIGTNMLPTNLSTITAADINNTNTEINKLKAALLKIGWGY